MAYLGAAAQGLGDGGEEGRQAGGAADELGDEDGGVVLRLDAVDPLQWRGRAACVRSALSVYMVRCVQTETECPNVLDKVLPIILGRRERISIYLATLLVSEGTGPQLQ